MFNPISKGEVMEEWRDKYNHRNEKDLRQCIADCEKEMGLYQKYLDELRLKLAALVEEMGGGDE